MKSIFFFISFFIINSSIAQISDFKDIDFNAADNVAKLHSGADLNNLPLLAHNLTIDLPSDVEKFRAIYTWVCNNIDGDPKQDNEVIEKREEFKNDSVALLKWNNSFKKIAFNKLFKQKKTMCTGYAYLIKELSFLADIECEIVDGYGRTTSTNADQLELTNHSWNAVKLNDKWYLVDATWSSGYFDDYNVFINEYNDGYFLTDPRAQPRVLEQTVRSGYARLQIHLAGTRQPVLPVSVHRQKAPVPAYRHGSLRPCLKATGV